MQISMRQAEIEKLSDEKLQELVDHGKKAWRFLMGLSRQELTQKIGQVHRVYSVTREMPKSELANEAFQIYFAPPTFALLEDELKRRKAVRRGKARKETLGDAAEQIRRQKQIALRMGTASLVSDAQAIINELADARTMARIHGMANNARALLNRLSRLQRQVTDDPAAEGQIGAIMDGVEEVIITLKHARADIRQQVIADLRESISALKEL